LQELLYALHNKKDEETISISSIARNHPSFGAKNLSLGTVRDPTVVDPWFPTVVKDDTMRHQYLANGFYQLPENALLVPVMFSSKRSTLWEDFFSVYTVLSVFEFDDRRPTLMNYGHDFDVSTSLLSTFGIESSNIGNVHGSSPPSVTTDNGEQVRSNLVCGAQGVAGLGMMAMTRLGDDILTHAFSQGAIMYSFRDFIFRNMDLKHIVTKSSTPSSSLAITIAFDGSSKEDWHESLRLNLEQRKPVADFAVQKVNTSNTLRNVMQLAAASTVFIARPGSDVLLAAATCLPRGSTLIVLDNLHSAFRESEEGSRDIERRYLEKSSYFNLHWVHTSPQDKTGLGTYETVADILIEKMRRQQFY
jgi:hypothetical protein